MTILRKNFLTFFMFLTVLYSGPVSSMQPPRPIEIYEDVQRQKLRLNEISKDLFENGNKYESALEKLKALEKQGKEPGKRNKDVPVKAHYEALINEQTTITKEIEKARKQYPLETISAFEGHRFNTRLSAINDLVYANLKFHEGFYNDIKRTFNLKFDIISYNNFHATLPAVRSNNIKADLEDVIAMFCACDILPYRADYIVQNSNRNPSLNLYFKLSDPQNKLIKWNDALNKNYEFHIDLAYKGFKANEDDLKKLKKHINDTIEDMEDKKTIHELNMKNRIMYAITNNNIEVKPYSF